MKHATPFNEEDEHLPTEVLETAETALLLSLKYRKDGLLALARHGLLAEKPDEIERMGDHGQVAADTGFVEALDELTTLLGPQRHHLALEEISISRMRAQERSGEFYPHTAQVAFPPQVSEKHGLGGIIVPIRDVLEWLAERDPAGKPILQAISAEFYPEDWDLIGDDEDDFEAEAA